MTYMHSSRQGCFIAIYADGSELAFNIVHVPPEVESHFAYVTAIAKQRSGDLPAGLIVSVKAQ